MRWTMILLLTLGWGLVQAQDSDDGPATAVPQAEPTTDQETAPPPPDDLEPEVTIRTEGETKFEEHRLNGRLVMVKVTPKHGVPYYLLDRDGDGQFETRLTDLENDVSVPMWLIKKW